MDPQGVHGSISEGTQTCKWITSIKKKKTFALFDFYLLLLFWRGFSTVLCSKRGVLCNNNKKKGLRPTVLDSKRKARPSTKTLSKEVINLCITCLDLSCAPWHSEAWASLCCWSLSSSESMVSLPDQTHKCIHFRIFQWKLVTISGNMGHLVFHNFCRTAIIVVLN